jgi:hypothetical protein
MNDSFIFIGGHSPLPAQIIRSIDFLRVGTLAKPGRQVNIGKKKNSWH